VTHTAGRIASAVEVARSRRTTRALILTGWAPIAKVADAGTCDVTGPVGARFTCELTRSTVESLFTVIALTVGYVKGITTVACTLRWCNAASRAAGTVLMGSAVPVANSASIANVTGAYSRTINIIRAGTVSAANTENGHRRAWDALRAVSVQCAGVTRTGGANCEACITRADTCAAPSIVAGAMCTTYNAAAITWTERETIIAVPTGRATGAVRCSCPVGRAGTQSRAVLPFGAHSVTVARVAGTSDTFPIAALSVPT